MGKHIIIFEVNSVPSEKEPFGDLCIVFFVALGGGSSQGQDTFKSLYDASESKVYFGEYQNPLWLSVECCPRNRWYKDSRKVIVKV